MRDQRFQQNLCRALAWGMAVLLFPASGVSWVQAQDVGQRWAVLVGVNDPRPSGGRDARVHEQSLRGLSDQLNTEKTNSYVSRPSA